MGLWKNIVALLLLLLNSCAALAEKFTIAAASDLRYALNEVIVEYRKQYPNHEPTVIYGSSGKMTTQIVNGAPYDIFFSADIGFPQKLHAEGFAVTEPAVYAIGRVVLWSANHDASQLTLKDLAADKFRRIAIAQPAHAPYGQRAKEAMQAAGVWAGVQSKLVFGENIAHTAQMAESGAADIAIIALSLAKFPAMARRGYHLIDETLHQPLTQGYVVTSHGEGKAGVGSFIAFMETDTAHQIMEGYGFVMAERDSAEIPE